LELTASSLLQQGINVLNQLSIQAKLILTTSILLICGSLASLYLNHSALTEIASRQFEQQLELAANALGEQMSGAVRFSKTDIIDTSYRALRKRYPDVLSAIVVRNNNDDVLLADGREQRFQSALDQIVKGLPTSKSNTTTRHDVDGFHYFVTQMPILFGDKRQPVGTLILLADFDALDHDVAVLSRNLMLVWVGILVTIIVLVLVSSSVVLQAPLTRLHEMAKNLNGGQADLASRINVSGSREITNIATEFNHFINTIQTLVKQLVEQTQVLTDLKRKGAQVSASLQKVVEVQSDKLASTSHEVESLAGITGRIRQLTEQSGQRIDSVTDITRDSIKSIASVRDQIVSLEHSIQDSSRAINDLSEKSQTIGSVLDVIRGIAEQTNLLALNAAIEAARAGEQGRGFAVVADEVRSLAGKTQRSTEEIQAMIGGLQAGSLRAVEQMQASNSDVRNSVQHITEASEVIASVGTRISELKGANNEIDQITRTQLALSEHLTELLHGVTENSQQTAQQAQENKQITQLIENEITRSGSIIAQFRH